MLLVICGFAGYLAHAPAHAQSPEPNVTGSPFHVINSLLEKGIDRVGAIDLQELKQKFRQVKVMALPIYPVGGNSASMGTRDAAIFIVEKEMVVLSVYRLAEMSEYQQSAILTHEHLSALGYVDDDYQMTAPLLLLADPDVNASHLMEFGDTLLSALVQPKTRAHTPTAQVSANGGTITGVGGGGDGVAIEIKVRALMALTNEDSHPTTDEKVRSADIERVLAMRIEPRESSSSAGVSCLSGLSEEKENPEALLQIGVDRACFQTLDGAGRRHEVERLLRNSLKGTL